MSLPAIDEHALWELFCRAEDIGLKLELTDGGITSETFPGVRHQRLAVTIHNTIKRATGESSCDCYPALDVYIRFADGAVKRPDISIFCGEPAEQEGFVHTCRRRSSKSPAADMKRRT
jgi:hypothetical protein